LRLSGGKMNRNGPRIILPNKMFEWLWNSLL
jgi:hypothetical protein